MKGKQNINTFGIRKYKIGTFSTVLASVLFIGGLGVANDAQAAEDNPTVKQTDTEKPVVQAIGEQTGKVGEDLKPINVVATDNVGVEGIAVSGLPSGVVYNNENATIVGTPVVQGDFTVSVEVNDKAGNKSDVHQFLLKVAPESKSVSKLADIPFMKVNKGEPIKLVNIYKEGVNLKKILSAKVTGLPKGVTFTEATGIIEGTPTEEGLFTVQVTASLTKDRLQGKSFLIQVGDGKIDAPKITDVVFKDKEGLADIAVSGVPEAYVVIFNQDDVVIAEGLLDTEGKAKFEVTLLGNDKEITAVTYDKDGLESKPSTAVKVDKEKLMKYDDIEDGTFKDMKDSTRTDSIYEAQVKKEAQSGKGSVTDKSTKEAKKESKDMKKDSKEEKAKKMLPKTGLETSSNATVFGIAALVAGAVFLSKRRKEN
ncbi:YSIRK signal domain/LPXTG anchor domain surface protein [Staphylococcus massiliensis CCUG 55927]|uniref:YSIRK signal domain/LPXTG anchor domain surface protein n=1 Tax=Staphylococcus massiliensis TaxID=555791 RepID=UPI0002D81ED6|nr:YSIRK signal domain/LPXTG anchor domain surface protein [Staphylococcus massiliensis]MCG3400810.1 YSIRK signal domain/LPXTG anchor domain surface protein [Staphylococcus massiliensis]PNZ99951.1 YSIRK signal domain/LPXTG anchor domain surface protein [Staphylococcus massiliensis CCUG 55927]